MNSPQAMLFAIRKDILFRGDSTLSFFFKGCNMDCPWCPYPEGISSAPHEFTRKTTIEGMPAEIKTKVGFRRTLDELLEFINEKRERLFRDNGYIIIAGGEPLIQKTFVLELARECHELGLPVVLHTSGYIIPHEFTPLIGKFDVYLYNLNIIDSARHKQYCGRHNLHIRYNLARLYEEEQDVEIVFNVVPGMTDSPDNIDRLKRFLGSLQTLGGTISLIGYPGAQEWKFARLGRPYLLSGTPPSKKRDLNRIRKELKSIGWNAKIF